MYTLSARLSTGAFIRVKCGIVVWKEERRAGGLPVYLCLSPGYDPVIALEHDWQVDLAHCINNGHVTGVRNRYDGARKVIVSSVLGAVGL